MLNVLLYYSTIIGRLHPFIGSVQELRFLERNLRIIAEKCKNSSNKILRIIMKE